MSHETSQRLSDGYRALLFTGPVRLHPRRGSLIQARFPSMLKGPLGRRIHCDTR